MSYRITKKNIVLHAGLCVALTFAGCKSSESAYKKAYEKAKAQESVQTSVQTRAPVIAPLAPAPVTQMRAVDNVDNTTVRTKDVTAVSGGSLSAFSAVVGSLGLKANAEGLQHTLQSTGYEAQITYNSARNMYRVAATTHADGTSAVASRNQFRSKYPDAWLLYRE